jgi:hypothetical protein
VFRFSFEPAGVEALALGDACPAGSGRSLGSVTMRVALGAVCRICWRCCGCGLVWRFRRLGLLPAAVAESWGFVLQRLSPFPLASLNGRRSACDRSSRPSCSPLVASGTSRFSAMTGQEAGRVAFCSGVGARVSGAWCWLIRGCRGSPVRRPPRSVRTRYQEYRGLGTLFPWDWTSRATCCRRLSGTPDARGSYIAPALDGGRLLMVVVGREGGPGRCAGRLVRWARVRCLRWIARGFVWREYWKFCFRVACPGRPDPPFATLGRQRSLPRAWPTGTAVPPH